MRCPLARVLCETAILAAGGALCGSAQTTIYEVVRLIIGDGSAPIESGALVVQNGRFTTVVTRNSVKAPLITLLQVLVLARGWRFKPSLRTKDERLKAGSSAYTAGVNCARS